VSNFDNKSLQYTAKCNAESHSTTQPVSLQPWKVASCWLHPTRAVRRRRQAAAADRMSASRRRRFRDVFTSYCNYL